MRILVLSGLYPDPGRPTHGLFVQRFLEALASAKGWEFSIVAPRPVAPPLLGRLLPPLAPESLPPERLLRQGRALHYPRYRHLRGLGLFLAGRAVARAAAPVVAEVLRRDPAQVLFGVYLYPYGVAAAALARRHQLPLWLSGRGSDVLQLARIPLVRGQVRAALRQARFLHGVSEELARSMEELAELPRGSVGVAMNGVDTRLFHPGPRPGLRRSWGVPTTSCLALQVGRLQVDPKGQDVLLKAMPSLDPTLHAVLVGDGPDRKTLSALASSLGVADRVHFLGPMAPERLAECYREADLFVLPSLREGCPNVLLEALASGLPCVASAVGAVPAILDGGRLGILVKERDPRALALALAGALERSPGAAAVRSFAEQWSWAGAAERFAGLAGRAMGWSR